MEKEELSKATSPTGKPKKPFFSKGGCIVAIIFFSIVIFFYTYGDPLNKYQPRAYDAAANADIKSAYVAALEYFTDYPTGSVSLSKLTSYGFTPSSNVTLRVLSGNQSNLKIIAFHTKGKKLYTIDSDGNMSFQKR